MTPKKKKRIEILHKWTQGNQLVMKTIMRYGNKEIRPTVTLPLEVIDNPAQYRAMMEESYEQNRPRIGVDLSVIPDSIE